MEKSFFLLSVFLLASTAYAARHPDCISGRIGTLTFADGDNDSEEELRFLDGRPSAGARYSKYGDICELADSKMPDELKVLRKQLSDLNQQTAKAFGIDVKRLFTNSKLINIEISSHSIGPYASSADNPMQMHVFPTWGLKGKPNKIDAGIYLHELGHKLIEGEATAIPKAILKLGSSDFLGESIPDLLALSVAKALPSNVDGLPSCIVQSLRPSSGKGYGDRLGFFVSGSALNSLVKCCNQLSSTSALKDEASLLCSDYLSPPDENPWITQTRRLTPSDITDAPKGLSLDEHQLGVPFKQLFARLADNVGTTPLAVFLKAASALDQTKTSDKLKCEIPKLKNWLAPVHAGFLHYQHLLDAVDKSLTLSQKLFFASLQKTLNVGLGVEFVNADLKRGIERGVFNSNFSDKIRAYESMIGTAEGKELKATGCFRRYDGDWLRDPMAPGCSVTCSLSP